MSEEENKQAGEKTHRVISQDKFKVGPKLAMFLSQLETRPHKEPDKSTPNLDQERERVKKRIEENRLKAQIPGAVQQNKVFSQDTFVRVKKKD